jgi:ribosomal protein S18 acetylase RimI-like enzyme
MRAIRLRALAETPEAFGQTLAEARAMSDDEYARRARAGAAGQERIFLVAESDAAGWVGMVGGYDEGRRAALLSMWVAPTHRRQGLGQQLIARLLDWASGRRAQEMHLFVSENNEPARALYASMGFVASGRTAPLAWNTAVTEVEMVRTMPGTGARG